MDGEHARRFAGFPRDKGQHRVVRDQLLDDDRGAADRQCAAAALSPSPPPLMPPGGMFTCRPCQRDGPEAPRTPEEPDQPAVEGEAADRHERRHVGPALETQHQTGAGDVNGRKCVDAEGLQLDVAVEPILERLDNELAKGSGARAGARHNGEDDEQPTYNDNCPPRDTYAHLYVMNSSIMPARSSAGLQAGPRRVRLKAGATRRRVVPRTRVRTRSRSRRYGIAPRWGAGFGSGLRGSFSSRIAAL